MIKKENYKLLLSREFRDILRRIDDKISAKILHLHDNPDFGFNFSFIDVTDKEDFISYSPSKKFIELETNGENPKVIWKISRNEQRIGRLVSKLTGEDPNTIEKFVNSYKAEFKYLNNLDDFRIISGNEISKYYSGKSYSDGSGPLNKSCMRHDHCGSFFKMYEDNPEKIKMVLLLDRKDRGKILGRALLWKVDEPEIEVLDRIYTVNDSDLNLFIKLANKNGWVYKKSQKFDETYFIDLDGKTNIPKCKIYLNDHVYKQFPYLDTFLFYDVKEKYLTNDMDEYKTNKHIVRLRATDGREQGNENYVYDIYNDDTVHIEETVYCVVGDCRIHRKDAISIGPDIYASPSDVRFSEYDKNFYPRRETVWSVYNRSFINKKNSVVVYLDEEGTKFDYIHSDMDKNIFEYVHDKDDYFLKELLIKGIDDKYYLKNQYDEEMVKKIMEDGDALKTLEDYNKYFDEFLDNLKRRVVERAS
jgi:hypothetical protein